MVYTSKPKKPEALALRRKGQSIGEIEKKLDIPRSTLSGWFQNISLTDIQKTRLAQRSAVALSHAREKAAEHHRLAKQERIKTLKQNVDEWYRTLPFERSALEEVALAMLYLGEGSKTKSRLGMGNSDPMIIKFYIAAIEKLYGIKREQLRFELHLRDDQNEAEMKKFWSKAANIPIAQFRYVLKDKRTVGRPTYPHYKGVCYVGGGGVEIQRRLMYLAEVFCKGI